MKDHLSVTVDDPSLDEHIVSALASMLGDAPRAEASPREPGDLGTATPPARRARIALLAAAALVAVVGVGGLLMLPTRGTDSDDIVPAVSNTLSDPEPTATTPDPDPTTVVTAAPEPSPDVEATIADALGLDELAVPRWFAARSIAPGCGAWVSDTVDPSNGPASLDCFSAAIANNERAEIVTVHAGDGLRVARWIVTVGTGPFEAEQFAVDSLVVDERAGTTRWFETRCVEGDFVDGRLVGDFVVGRDQVAQLDPSGTIVTDTGEVVELPGPDDRMQLAPCSEPVGVDPPVVSPLEATGLRIGDQGSPVGRIQGLNEVGQYDLTIVPSWTPVGDAGGVIGFARTGTLDLPPSAPQADGSTNTPIIIYADDGTTRIGQFGPDGRPTLDR